MKSIPTKYYWLIIFAVVLVVYWLIPIEGSVIFYDGKDGQSSWPRFDVTEQSQPAGTVVDITVRDVKPWSYVELTAGDVSAIPRGSPTQVGILWNWHWSFVVPDDPFYNIVFYRNCHTGCEERGRMAVGTPNDDPTDAVLPVKLGVVMPNPEREWYGHSGWAVEITYATFAEDPYWGVDDLASRIAGHNKKGLRVLVRVDYDQRQSIPANDDYVALSEYLTYFRRLARDDRLDPVYGYIVGNDYNTYDAAVLHPDKPITPEWYARVFNGYSEDPHHTDNVLQTIRNENQQVRVIVGPVRPWSTNVDGKIKHATDMPWLNYMNSVTSYLDEANHSKNAIGVSQCAPDGFDIQAPGHPDVVEMAGFPRYEEPAIVLERAAWNNARIGFGVYEDWLSIINAYESTHGLPVYIISTNTYDRDANIPPAQNFPQGWLTTALHVINAEPQIHALCWFLDDFPHSDQWDWFSLTQQSGRLVDAAEEFDTLLKSP